MSTSTYFSKFSHVNEQNLIEDIVIESIQIYGHDISYLPRISNNLDELLGEDPSSSFNTAYPIEMYIKNTDGFEGEGSFLSKFGLEIRDQITFTVAKRTWSSLGVSNRPKEGDLIWFPLTSKLFEIQFVEHESVFYQTGRLQVYDIQCELFEYSDEAIDTGIATIDAIEADNAFIQTFPVTFVDLGFLLLEDSSFIVDEDTTSTEALTGKGNKLIQDTILNFKANEVITGQVSLASAKITTANATHIHVSDASNTFSFGEQIIGSTSTAKATLGAKIQASGQVITNDPLANNVTIETIADSIIDFTENNPFSESY